MRRQRIAIAKDDVNAPALAARADETDGRARVQTAPACENARLAATNDDDLAASARRKPWRTVGRLLAMRVVRYDVDEDVRMHADGAATAPRFFAESILDGANALTPTALASATAAAPARRTPENTARSMVAM